MNKAVLLLLVIAVLSGHVSWGANTHRGRKPKVVVVKFDVRPSKDKRRGTDVAVGSAKAGQEVTAAQSRLYARRSTSVQDDQLDKLGD